MKIKRDITLLFLLIAAMFGLLMRLIHTGVAVHTYKYLLHTHSHIALLGWLYNAALIVLQYTVLKTNSKTLNRIFWLTQLTFAGMLFSFPFQGYAATSITFSTLYMFCSYFLVYHLYKQTKTGVSVYVAKFIRWGGVYLILSSIGPYALGAIMANKLAHTFWFKLAIYWFLHFLYNGFFLFVVFAYLLHKFKDLQNAKKIFRLMNASTIPLFALSVLWLKPAFPFYLLSVTGALLQIIAFVFLIKGQNLRKHFHSSLNFHLVVLALLAYGLKVCFQLVASFAPVQNFINGTGSYSIIGFVHLVMLGFFSLFFFAAFISESYLKASGLLKTGLYLFVAGILLSELLLFSQSLLVYFNWGGIDNFFKILFWASTLMPAGILLVTVQSLREK